ncbi:MAG TPA: inosine/xanthosine triphosphatase [Anaerolineae bacterium]|nr:inosine/xanthosine triphosphatase [Anaerolineae bacterium]
MTAYFAALQLCNFAPPPMLITVGSLNPIKIAAVQAVFSRQWPQCEVSGIAVDTGVSEMPMSDAECIAGARNRARAALRLGKGTFGVGLEGGVNPESSGLMLLGWVVIVHRDGREGIACTAKIPLPDLIAQRVLAGEQLGMVMDDLLQEQHTAQRGGAAGALSNGLVMRQDKFAMAVAYALSPFVAPQFYQGNE